MQNNLNTGLTRTQIEQLESLLIDNRRELADMIDGQNQQITMKRDCSIADSAEAAGLLEETARATGLAELHHEKTVEICDALRRIKNGSYGISENSGEPIPFERLLLVPWARTGLVDEMKNIC